MNVLLTVTNYDAFSNLSIKRNKLL